MREPDFTGPEFSEATERIVDQIVAKHAMHVLKWLLAAIVASALTVLGATVWCTKIFIKIEDMGASMARQEQATAERIRAWGDWRDGVDAKLRALDAKTPNGDRWTRTSMRDYNSQLSFLNRTLTLPDVDVIANRQANP